MFEKLEVSNLFRALRFFSPSRIREKMYIHSHKNVIKHKDPARLNRLISIYCIVHISAYFLIVLLSKVLKFFRASQFHSTFAHPISPDIRSLNFRVFFRFRGLRSFVRTNKEEFDKLKC